MKKSVINLTQSRSEGRAATGTLRREKITVGIDCENECRRRCGQDYNAE